MDTETKVNKKMVFDRTLRRLRVIFTTATIISLIFCCFIPITGYSKTDRVNELIQKLKDGNSGVRMNAALELGKIKDTRAVEPLIATLKDKDPVVRMNAAWALGYIEDTRAVEPLIATLKAKDLAIVAGAYSFFIHKGEPKSIPILIDALKKYGDIKMATDFSNCGNSQLKEAARAWEKKHRAVIKPGGSSGPQWGSKK
ncbi:HEAT repeat domain-containing protein [bacterium]|nr:HEAT repeat domain-containing protein [bacterium]MBU1599963.1 HEAT repeat domain-containing protein [bacterium]